MYRNKRILAVVPARGGSKGIPGKNLKPIRGMSLVARAARTIAEAGVVDRAICSTDDAAIAAEASAAGLSVPELRPPALSSDEAKSVDVWRHVWLAAEVEDGVTYDAAVLIEPTSPLRRAADIVRTVDALFDEDAKAAATVSRTPGHFTPHKTLTISEAGRVGFYVEGGGRYSRRQDIPEYFHRNGVCYAALRATIIDDKTIVEDDCAAVVIERPLVNIDEPLDLEVAELLAAREAW